MSDAVEVLVVNTSPKKAKASKPKKAKTAPSHPKVSEMVNSAIGNLKERGGSSLQAIKKYVGAHYKVDIEKLSPFIKKYLKTAVATGALVQTKGKGATGSFRLSSSAGGTKEKSASKDKPKATKKPKAAATPKKAKSAPKKTAKPKAAPKKKPAVKKSAPVKKSLGQAKPKATPKKAAAKKPKASKPKPKSSPKKAAAKKGKK